MHFEQYLAESKLSKHDAESIVSQNTWELTRRGVLESGKYRIDLDNITNYKKIGRIRDPAKTVKISSFTLREGGLPVFSIEKRVKGETNDNDKKHADSLEQLVTWVNKLTKLNLKKTDFK